MSKSAALSIPPADPLAAKRARPHRFDPTLQGHRLTVAYRGTAFSGWQRQPKKRTVQECLEGAASKIWERPLVVHGSGRTDTGVHALGQVVSFNAAKLHSAPTVIRAMNANLPLDVRVMHCRLVSPAFHARFDATGKTYKYLIWNQTVQDPFTVDTHWHVPRDLNLPAMRAAAAQILGQHDFASFTSNPGYSRETTVRTLSRASLHRSGPVLIFTCSGNGFLYRMVRNIVGALVRVGQERIQPHDFGAILAARKRSEAPATAPACGLYLTHVVYGKKEPSPHLPIIQETPIDSEDDNSIVNE